MLIGKNVTLRAVEPSDVEILYNWENNMALWPVTNTLTPFSRHQLEQYVKASNLDIYHTRQLRLIIEVVSRNKRVPAGLIDLFDFDPYHLRGGLGIMMNEKWRGKGLAKEALGLFINYAFDHIGLHQLYCNIPVSNKASLQLFNNAGFTLAGVKKEWLKTKAGWEDELLFQLINLKYR